MGDAMTFNYAASALTASRLLAKFGQAVTLSKVVPGVYDPVTGEHSGSTTQTQTAKAAILPVGGDDVGQTFGEGDMVRQDDRKALIEVAGKAPDVLTTLTDSAGGVWDIKVVKPLDPAAIAVMYTAFVRR